MAQSPDTKTALHLLINHGRPRDDAPLFESFHVVIQVLVRSTSTRSSADHESLSAAGNLISASKFQHAE
jgi:hypothetical protein